jgi:alanyl-tRNA synthetase
VAFQLHDTYGFFIDIIEQMAGELGMGVDRNGFDRLMAHAKEKARAGQKKLAVSAIAGELPRTDDSLKYGSLRTTSKVLGWVKDNTVIRTGSLSAGEEAALLLERTDFYAEQGGQIGDVGIITTPTGAFNVEDTQKLGDAVLHLGCVMEGHVEPSQSASIQVDGGRLDTMRHHTATHLLNWALRKVLGDHVDQKGSKVKPDAFTFDFSHSQKLTRDEMDEVERLVNDKICADLTVTSVVMPLAKAKTIPGVRALFGEKYPDPVRVILIGAEKPEDATIENSVEFCGGTHLNHTGQTGYFMIHREDAIGKGVRRLTCLAGQKAVQQVQSETRTLMDLAEKMGCQWNDFPQRVQALQEDVKKLQTQLKKGLAGDLNSAADKLLAEALVVNGANVIVGELPAAPIDQMRAQVDRLRTKAKSAVVCLGWVEDGQVMLLAGVTDDLTKKIEAGKLIGEMAKVVGGKGGGRKDMAQAGGNDPSKLGEALALAKKTAQEKLN